MSAQLSLMTLLSLSVTQVMQGSNYPPGSCLLLGQLCSFVVGQIGNDPRAFYHPSLIHLVGPSPLAAPFLCFDNGPLCWWVDLPWVDCVPLLGSQPRRPSLNRPILFSSIDSMQVCSQQGCAGCSRLFVLHVFNCSCLVLCSTLWSSTRYMASL